MSPTSIANSHKECRRPEVDLHGLIVYFYHGRASSTDQKLCRESVFSADPRIEDEPHGEVRDDESAVPQQVQKRSTLELVDVVQTQIAHGITFSATARSSTHKPWNWY